jgi:hypothetical protein
VFFFTLYQKKYQRFSLTLSWPFSNQKNSKVISYGCESEKYYYEAVFPKNIQLVFILFSYFRCSTNQFTCDSGACVDIKKHVYYLF